MAQERQHPPAAKNGIEQRHRSAPFFLLRTDRLIIDLLTIPDFAVKREVLNSL